MSAARQKAELKTNSDGSVTVQYVPTASGSHDVNVTYNEQPVSGTPTLIIILHLSEGAQLHSLVHIYIILAVKASYTGIILLSVWAAVLLLNQFDMFD